MIKLKEKRTKETKKLKLLLPILMIILISLIFLDYFNVLSKYQIMVTNFNLDFWNIFINLLVVIILYIITYSLIDKKIVEQSKNKSNIAFLLLKETYSACKEDIEWMEKEDYRNDASKKIKGDEDLNNSVVYRRLVESPFENHDMILSFAKEGIITSTQLEDYLIVKKEFRIFITMSIVFYDKFEYVIDSKSKIEKNIDRAMNNLK